MNGVALVTDWCYRYVGRPPTPADLANGHAIDAGTLTPEALFPAVLACDECYLYQGGTDDRWVTMLVSQVARLPADHLTLYRWLEALAVHAPGYAGRLATAEEFLRGCPRYEGG